MFYSDVPVHHRITPASISTYHASTYFLVLMFYSDVPIHCRITPASISTYHANKYFLVHMFYSDVPVHHRITPASISTFHASKYFLVLMFYSDVPIHHRITPASISTYHASKYFLDFMFYSDVPIHCRITPSSISTYHALKIFSCSHVFFLMCQFIANLFKRERSTTKASPHPPSALCRPVPPLVHLDCVLQVPPFQPHQPPQKKSNPARRNQKFWLQPLMLRLVPFCFQTHPAF